LDRKRKKRTSNKEWKSPADGDARIAKMKDGRTHLAHKAEHAVDLDTGAVVAVTLQGAALVKKVVFDEVQRFPTNSTMQNPACVKREKFRTEDGFHGGCGIARECG
jgi:hypothetical protein